MRYNVLSRRMFLQGASGAALAIPFLPSLIGVEAKAATPDTLKYLQVIENMGALREQVRPAAQFVPSKDLGANTKSMALTDIIAANGQISDIYGPWWNDVAGSINLVSNFHGWVANPNHNTCAATCGSGLIPGTDSVEQAQVPWSVDYVIEKHLAAQGGGDVMRINIGSNSKYAQSHCFAGQRQNVRLSVSTYDQLIGAVAKPDTGQAVDANRTTLLNRIMEDYRRIATDSRLSSLDRERFTAYTDQIADVQRRESQELVCVVDPLDPSANYRIRHENSVKMLAKAFACGVTRAASYVIIDYADNEANGETLHTHHHDHPAELKSLVQWRSQIVATLVKELAATKDETGQSVLDSMVFYHAREYAHALNSTGDAHSNKVYSCLIGGKAGGRLQTGNYIDAGGAPTGRILTSLMKAMGIPTTQIEQGQVGFGEYSTNSIPVTDGDKQIFLSDAGKRLALPIVKGFDSATP